MAVLHSGRRSSLHRVGSISTSERVELLETRFHSGAGDSGSRVPVLLGVLSKPAGDIY